MQLAMRKDVPAEMTWDLTQLYKTEEDFLRDVEKMEALAERLEGFRGRLGTAENIVACLDTLEQFLILEDTAGTYCSLSADTDYYNTAAQERQQRFGVMDAGFRSRIAFIDSEITDADSETLEKALSLAKGCRNHIRELQRQKPHRLSPETEKALAALSRNLDTPSVIYNTAKLADMRFDSFTVRGESYPLGYSLFEDNYEYEKDTDIRRAAFKAFSDKLRQYENTTAAAYNACVQTEKTMSVLRGFDSVFDYLLYDQKVTREMYDRQIDVITERLAPHMRRYARLLQKIHGLDRMTFADLKISVDPEYDPVVSVEEAKEYIKKGLAVMGPETTDMVERAFTERWFDLATNQGKSTGGYCAGPYGNHAYILMSYQNRMSDVCTLAHELGHAGHFAHFNACQSKFDAEPTGYFIEAPSTMNELLMEIFLADSAPDKRFRRFILSSMISNNYYHNFVTHLREAWYQREVYRIIDAGGSVSAETLSGIFRRNLELFWGDAVEINEGAELTWMRQPHYYMGLYSYTYSAGLTIGTEAARRIEREGAPAAADWKKVLSAGGTLDPVGLAALMKIDITTDEPLKRTIDYIGSIIDEIVKLTEELDGITLD